MENTSTNTNNIEIVIARYNEDLSWLRRGPFNSYPNIIYNKGKSSIDPFPMTHSVVNLENTGRDYGTYMHHIVTNYDNLANLTIFLPGSTDNAGKERKAIRLLMETEKHQDTVFLGDHVDNILRDKFDFCMDSYMGSDARNDRNQALTHAAIRPFGPWYINHFQALLTQKVCFQGVVAVSRRDALQQPVSYYQSFLDELSVGSNPEVGHYIEHSWQAIFHKAINPLLLTTIYDDPKPAKPIPKSKSNMKKIMRMRMFI
jgi:hypothetical protein